MTTRRMICGQYRGAGKATDLTFYNTMLSRLGYIKAGRLSDPETDEDLNTWGIAA